MRHPAKIRDSLILAALACLLAAIPSSGKKKPEFSTVEITRFTNQQGVEVPPNFLDYLYEALFRSRDMQEVFARAIVENEAVSKTEAPHTLTLRGVILDFGKGSYAKSFIGFGIGRRSLETRITLVRRMDNATLFETDLKVRSKRQTDAKFLAVYMAKEIGNKLKNKRKEIREALLDADRRYVPPPVAAQASPPPSRAMATPAQAAPEPAAKEETVLAQVNPPAESLPAPAPPQEASVEESPEMGTVEVLSTVEGSEVYVDGNYLGNAPALVKLPPGKHQVRVAMAGEEDWQRELTVLAGSELKLYAGPTPRATPAPSPAPEPAAPDPKALSKQDILDLLTNFVPNARIAELVNEHGLKFKPTPTDMDEIEGAGADSSLIATIRKAASNAYP